MIAFGFTRNVPVDDKMIFTEYLYACEKIVAPGYSNHPNDDSKLSSILYNCCRIVKLVSCSKTVLSRFRPERDSQDMAQKNLIALECTILRS